MIVHIRHAHANKLRCPRAFDGALWTRSREASNCNHCRKNEYKALNRGRWSASRYGAVHMFCRVLDGGCGFHTYRLPASSHDCSRCGRRMRMSGETKRGPYQRANRPAGGALYRCACAALVFERDRQAHECAGAEVPSFARRSA